MKEILEIELKHLRASFDRLWSAVQKGQYDSRSILGDELLNMKAAFDTIDRHFPTKLPARFNAKKQRQSA